MIDLLHLAKRNFASKLPFVLFSKPNQDKIIGLFQKNDELYFAENFDESGFVFTSFDGEKQILIPENHSQIKVVDFNFEGNSSSDFSVLENENGKKAFENLVQKGIDGIEKGSFEKVVLSRKEIVAVENLDFSIIFERLLQTYPTAFNYCWFHPKVGMWIGATPEQLLKAYGLKINTVALAGTQKFKENQETNWGEKEIEEQKIVTDFIVDNLKDITSELLISEPYTLKAGSILHIKTDIEAVLKPENNLKRVLEILHPTPAVCGLPKEVSRDFIIRNEGYDREFYAGFLGELNKDFATSETKSDLFVNLRCMQVNESEAHLYVGCGITKDSIPDKEFVETANKAITMKRILAKEKREYNKEKREVMKLDILAFGAHPDDVELGCGGTLAKEISLGKKVGIADLTRGELGTRGSAEIRDKEASDAANILGVSIRENLKMRDGFFQNDEEHQLEIIKMIRKYKPEIVLCNAVEDRHIDHAKGSKLVSDSCFLSGLRRIETEFEGENQEAWRPKLVYHYIQWKNIEPDFVVDITGFNDKKIESIMAYSSQFYNPDTKEPTTPIATKNFLDSLHYRAQDLGRLIGTDYAEGFTVERYLAVNSLGDLI